MALGAPAQVLGIPAPVASAAAGAQVAAAARGEAGESRSVREMQDSHNALRRIHDKIDGKTSGPIYKGTSSGELSVRNNPFLIRTRSPR